LYWRPVTSIPVGWDIDDLNAGVDHDDEDGIVL
jgi:hypothetical protein